MNLKLDRDEKIEFKVSNNEIHIRACPDSFSALCQLIESFSSPTSSPSGTNYNTNITYNENGNSNFDNLSYPDGDLIEDAMGDVHQELDSNEDLLINSDDDQIDFKTDEGSPPLDESSFFITAPIFYVNGGNSDSSFSNCNCNFVEFQILILVTCTL